MEPISLHIGCKKILGDKYYLLDPDTIEDSFLRMSNIKLNREYKDMISALTTLFVTDVPYRDYLTFEKVVWALNGFSPRMDIIEMPPVELIAYAMSIIKSIGSFEVDDEIWKYIASVLSENGYLVAPSQLSGAQKYLNKFIPETFKTVKSKLEKAKLPSLEKLNINMEDPVSVQLARLASVNAYLTEKENILREELKHVNS